MSEPNEKSACETTKRTKQFFLLRRTRFALDATENKWPRCACPGNAGNAQKVEFNLHISM